MFKYPRTLHVRGSRFQHGDHDLEAVPPNDLIGKHLVVEEKVDGSNVGISFDERGSLLLQSRGHYLRGGPREKQFNLLKQWSTSRQEELFCALGSRYVLYGEWLYAKHTAYYDALPHYFMEFDVLDTSNGTFLDTPRRRQLLACCSLEPVKVIWTGVLWSGTAAPIAAMGAMITRSNFITDQRMQHLEEASRVAGVDPATALKHTDMDERMEGLYVKWEEGGIVRGRYKYVRSTFTSSILDQEEHWHDRPIIQNRLEPGAFEAMFK